MSAFSAFPGVIGRAILAASGQTAKISPLSPIPQSAFRIFCSDLHSPVSGRSV
jgi:hypothetical protein